MTAVLGLAILLAAAPSSAGPQPPAEADSHRAEPTAAQALAASTARTDRSAAATVDGVRRLAGPDDKGRTAEPQYEPHTVLVRFKTGTSASVRGRVAGRIGGKVSTGATAVGYVKITTSGPAAEAVAALRADAAVTDVALDYGRTKSKVPNDYYYAQYQKYLSTVRLPQAWDLQSAATGVTIAIVDTGVDGGHPDLAGKLVPGYNSVANNNQTADYDGHGTMVAGIAAANTNNTYGVAGAAYNGRIMPIMVFSGEYAYDSDIAEGVIWAVDHGAKIVNMSLGGAGQTPVLHEAIKYAVGKGVLVVVAAGNTGDDSPHYPAMYPEVLTVGATDHAAALTDFSSWGDHVDLAAPGFDIISTHSRATPLGYNFAYGIGAGTSFSSPLVAGVAALVRAKYPSLTPAQVMDKLKSTARDAGPRGIDPYYGHGVLDAYRALGGPATTPFPLQLLGAGEPNDVPARAVAFTSPVSQNGPAATMTGSIAVEGDVDWFRFQMPVDGQVMVQMIPPGPDREPRIMDPVIAVYDAELRLAGEGDDPYGPDAGETLTVPVRAGTAYIKVRTANGVADPRPYQLSVHVTIASSGFFPAFTNVKALRQDDTYGRTLALGDVTGDGRVDALLAPGWRGGWTNESKLVVYPQLPDGALGEPVKYPVRHSDSIDPDVVVVDADHDGRQDVALITSAGVEVLRQNGAGTLEAGALVYSDTRVRHLAAGDLDGDGDQDLVVNTDGSGAVVLMLTQEPAGVFAATTIGSGSSSGGELEIGDVNNDSRLDVTVPSPGGVTSYLAGTGGWTAVPHVVYTGTANAGAVEVADVTGDGLADLLVLGADRLDLLRQVAGGAFAAPAAVTVPERPRTVEVADWDRDGLLDIVTSHENGSVVVVRQQAGGYATPISGGLSVSRNAGPNSTALGDLNSDGYTDIAGIIDPWDGLVAAYNVLPVRPVAEQWWIRDVSVADLSTAPQTVRLTVKAARKLDPATVNSQTIRLLSGVTARAYATHVSYDASTGTITVTLVRPRGGLGRNMAARDRVITGRTPYRLVIGAIADVEGNVHRGYSMTYVS
ncbi:S8 family serine peptidase [Catellatospora bangladeshensis]|uniref:Peptidase S8/S53 domain-containing protein n=1 Tax=Catellatospora bangladeshensis TaxID=310355 RepID=A0A8J3NJA3_9ACTN|nr:S8 family serine peptidase [Catellatospora bangladeshensis]GIF81251.1 hypothetical protein Cba03nite_26000 [Catellatospora bangladeshensis]